jgi:hypothetical protein
MVGLKRSDSIDGGAFPQAPDHFRATQKANRREPEQAATDYGLDVADLSSGCDDPVDARRHAIDRPARITRGMLHRPGQDAVQHGTDGKPKTTHVMMLIHVLRDP